MHRKSIINNAIRVYLMVTYETNLRNPLHLPLSKQKYKCRTKNSEETELNDPRTKKYAQYIKLMYPKNITCVNIPALLSVLM